MREPCPVACQCTARRSKNTVTVGQTQYKCYVFKVLSSVTSKWCLSSSLSDMYSGSVSMWLPCTGMTGRLVRLDCGIACWLACGNVLSSASCLSTFNSACGMTVVALQVSSRALRRCGQEPGLCCQPSGNCWMPALLHARPANLQVCTPCIRLTYGTCCAVESRTAACIGPYRTPAYNFLAISTMARTLAHVSPRRTLKAAAG